MNQILIAQSLDMHPGQSVEVYENKCWTQKIAKGSHNQIKLRCIPTIVNQQPVFATKVREKGIHTTVEDLAMLNDPSYADDI